MGLINEVANIKEEISKTAVDKAKKEFYKELQQKTKAILFDKIMLYLNNNIYINSIFTDEIKDQIIDETLKNILQIYILKDKTQEKINFFCDDIYYATAKKTLQIYNKRQELQEEIKAEKEMEENKKRLLLQYEEIQKENERKQKEQEEEQQKEKEIKKQMILYWLMFIMFFLFLLFIT